MLHRLRREPELASRLVFGTDYPIPPTSLPLVGHVRPAALLRALREKNPFDTPVLVLRALGLEPTSEPLLRLLPALGTGPSPVLR